MSSWALAKKCCNRSLKKIIHNEKSHYLAHVSTLNTISTIIIVPLQQQQLCFFEVWALCPWNIFGKHLAHQHGQEVTQKIWNVIDASGSSIPPYSCQTLSSHTAISSRTTNSISTCIFRSLRSFAHVWKLKECCEYRNHTIQLLVFICFF